MTQKAIYARCLNCIHMLDIIMVYLGENLWFPFLRNKAVLLRSFLSVFFSFKDFSFNQFSSKDDTFILDIANPSKLTHILIYIYIKIYTYSIYKDYNGQCERVTVALGENFVAQETVGNTVKKLHPLRESERLESLSA